MKSWRVVRGTRWFIPIMLVILVLLPLSILAAISYTNPSSPYNIFSRNPSRVKNQNSGTASGIIVNVAPEVESFDTYLYGKGLNSNPNVLSFSGRVIDYNGAIDIRYINVTVYDPHLRPMTTISWQKGTDILMQANPGLVLEGISDLPESQYYVDNGRMICWRVDNEGSVSEGIIEFQGVYTFGKGCVPGHYYIDLYVGDEREGAGEYVVDAVVYIEGEVKINIMRGWNLIALPLYPSQDLYAEDLINMMPNAGKVAYWDPSTQRFLSHIHGLPVRNFRINYGSGYFVKCDGPGTLTFRGTELDERNNVLKVGDNILYHHPIYPRFVNVLKRGWNCLGLPYHKGTRSASGVLSDINGGDILAYWDSYRQMYVTYISDGTGENVDIRFGEGYFVLASGDTRFNIEAIRSIEPEVMLY